AGDWDPGDKHCDTGKYVVRGVREEPRCMLRAALQEANASGGADITFDIADPAPYVIAPKSPLPAIEAPSSIRGKLTAAQTSSFFAAPEITIDGCGAGGTASGLTVATGGSGTLIEN